MKIGIVCYPTYGGSGVIATELGMALAKRGHQIHFITYRQPVRLNAFQENVYYHEVGKIDYPLFQYSPYETVLATKMADVVKYEKLDLLHVHYAIPHAAAAYLAKKILLTQGIYIPTITTLHGTDITLVGIDQSFAPVVAFSINKSDGVTAVSESLKNDTLAGFDIDREIEVINNFVDVERFKRTDKDHFRKAIAPNGEKILIHTSNFRKVKRVEDTIHIFQKVSEKIPSRLLLIGDGPRRQHVESLCRELHLCDQIRFLGKQDAIEELLAIADVFLMPSQSESFGLAALEAMACEVPVVSSNIGGLPNVNIDGVTGFLSEVGDTDKMANDVLKILASEETLLEFRQAARRQAERYSIENIVPIYEAYYEKILATSLYEE